MSQIFDRNKVRCAFDRAADTYDEAAVLQQEVCRRLLEKVDLVKISPDWILDAGSGTGEAVKPLQKKYKKSGMVLLDLSERKLAKAKKNSALFRRPHAICGDIESLPFADQQFGLIFSSLALQWCNALDASLLEMRRILQPGGLLIFATFGPDTLKELRSSWAKVDQAPHVNSFIDMHDIGDDLLRAGFSEPVMESEMITVNYSQVDLLMQDLRNIGANVTASGQNTGLLTPKKLQRLREAYNEFRLENQLPATYEIIYGHAWVGHNTRTAKDRVSSINVEFGSRS